MKLFKLNLDPLDPPLYKPSDTIQNFETLVWTERYLEAGDFQLVVENDIVILTELPLGTLISHTDTKEVMIVENYEFERDSTKTFKITISGRSFETFSENRITVYGQSIVDPVTGNNNNQSLPTGPSATAASYLLKNRLQDGFASVGDTIPNLLVVETIRVYDASMEHIVKRGDVYSRVLEYLGLCNSGIKIIRPNGAQTTMNVVVHDGLDKHLSVAFYAQYEDLEDTKYFSTIKNYKNYANVSAHIYARLYRSRDVLADVNGLNRRVIYVEADDLEGDYSPGTDSDVISERGQSVLNEHQIISLMQAKISQTAKPKFKFDYDIGDLVTVFGEFETSQIMRVTEHILTIDKDGMRGFPSLSYA